MKYLILLSGICFTTHCFAQQPAEITSAKGYGEVFTYVENMPTYLGDLKQFIAANTKYPDVALKNNIQGRVFVRFIVTATGNVDSVSVARGIGNGCDEEAVRVVKMMKWQPGTQNGKAVNVYYMLPIPFKLEDNNKEGK